MGLREQAALDAQSILEDSSSGFGWPFTLISPLGVAVQRVGFTTDVGHTIDPETGQAVAGRRASVAVSLRSLTEMPTAVAESTRKPWIVGFLSTLGVGHAFKVIEVLPDRAAGVVVLILEAYQLATVYLAGALMLPSLLLDGTVTPAVALAGALALPPLQLAGTVTPAVALAGALALPSPLQLAGTVTPAVALAGALALPSPLQLAGAVTPAVTLAGSLTLPPLQLAGTVTPTVRALAGSLVLPSLQLTGTITVGSTPVGAWLRLAASTINAGEYDAIADVLNPGNPTYQPGAVRKPAAGTSANGLPICIWDGTDVLKWNVVANNDSTAAWGLGVWIKCTSNITSRQRIFKAAFPGANAKVILDVVGGGFLFQCYLPGGVNGRQWTTESIPGGGAIANTWFFLRFQFNGAGGSDAACLKVFVNEVEILTGVFFNVGAGGAMTSINSATGGYYTIGAQDDSDTPSTPLQVGVQTGPNWYIYNAVPSAAAALATMNMDTPT